MLHTCLSYYNYRRRLLSNLCSWCLSNLLAPWLLSNLFSIISVYDELISSLAVVGLILRLYVELFTFLVTTSRSKLIFSQLSNSFQFMSNFIKFELIFTLPVKFQKNGVLKIREKINLLGKYFQKYPEIDGFSSRFFQGSEKNTLKI